MSLIRRKLERNATVNKQQSKNALMLQQAVEMMPENVRDQFVGSALKLMREASYPYRKLMAYYTCAMMEVETKLHVLNEEFSLQYDRNPISTIKSRLKSFSSIIEKLQRKGLSLNDLGAMEKQLNDIAGVRVVCSFPEDVYMLADALLKQDDIRPACSRKTGCKHTCGPRSDHEHGCFHSCSSLSVR